MTNEEIVLRQLLWEYHGCLSECLYGDDGEMQCHNIEKHGLFGADFRWNSFELLEWKLSNELYKKSYPRPKE